MPYTRHSRTVAQRCYARIITTAPHLSENHNQRVEFDTPTSSWWLSHYGVKFSTGTVLCRREEIALSSARTLNERIDVPNQQAPLRLRFFGI